MLELVQVHEFAGFGVESHGRLPLRLPPLLLLLLTGSPRHLLLQLVQLTAPWAWPCAETDKIIGQSREASYSRVSKFRCVHGHVPALVPPPQLGEGSSCRMAPLLFDLGTERHEGPDISTRFCCPTSLWRQREREGGKKGGKDVESADHTTSDKYVHSLICCTIVGKFAVLNVMLVFHAGEVKLSRKTRMTEKPREGQTMNDTDREEETVIVICERRTYRGCCCSSRCSRSHSPSSESDVAGAPPLSEVEGQGDPLSARCPETWAARPAQTPPPTPRPPSLPPLVTLAVRVERVPQGERSPVAPEGERVRAGCCSPERSLSVGWRCCRCSGPLSWASRLAGSGLQKNWRAREEDVTQDVTPKY